MKTKSNNYTLILHLEDRINAHLNIIGSVNLQDQREVKGKITGLKSTETQQVASVFNTIDWITKANRKLFRTNVYNR